MSDMYGSMEFWILFACFVIAFLLAFGIGANDVANSFGTSVGSGVLTLRQACVIATFCELAGSILIGYKVADTLRTEILDLALYEGDMRLLMLGCLASLCGSATFTLVATYLKLPISGTHSIVGSTIGFSLIARGMQGIKWITIAKIASSWVVSPLLSGIMSVLIFGCIRKFIIKSKNPLNAGLIAIPMFYALTCFVNVFSIVHDGPRLLMMDGIPTWVAIVASSILGLAVGLLIQIFVVPRQRKQILEKCRNKKPAEFIIQYSNESTPGDSPNLNRRPATIEDGNPLPSLTETTELVSFKDPASPNINKQKRRRKICGFPKMSSVSNGNCYRIDSKIIAKAEILLKSSLDNPDVTITSLNYIDEQQNGIPIKGYFDRQQTYRSPLGTKGQGDVRKSPNMESDVTIPTTDLPTLPKKGYIETNADLCNVNSAGNLDHMISATLSPNSSKLPLIDAKINTQDNDEPEEVSELFSFLQILTAAFGSFAHGGNDVSNAIGPLIAAYMIFKTESVSQAAETPIYILLFGGVGISFGLWLWGRRVIKTLGNDLTKLTPATGFTIEIGAALTVLLASKFGLPISTTHCKVGSIVFVGQINKRENTPEEIAAAIPQKAPVNWMLVRNIAVVWMVTLPTTALISAVFMLMFKFAL